MTDSELRELERRWREDGDRDAEAALLRARVRAGTLAAPRLRLAAYLGHEAARLALGDAAPELGQSGAAVAFCFGLEDYGREAWLRAVWVVMNMHEQHLGERTAATNSRPVAFKIERHRALLQRGLTLVEAWLREPSEEAQAELTRWSGAVPADRVGFALHAVRDAAGRISSLPQEEIVEHIRRVLLPWALGQGDPVLEEVRDRERAGG